MVKAADKTEGGGPEGRSTRDSMRRLKDAVDYSDERLATFRRNRQSFIRAFAGPYYQPSFQAAANRDNVTHEPLNLLFSTVSTLVPFLITQNPKAMCTRKEGRSGRFPDTLAGALDHVFREIELQFALRLALGEALWGLGVIKVGMIPADTPDVSNAFGYLANPDQVWAESVNLDDYVPDMAARHPQRMQFEGNRYLVDQEWAYGSPLYSKKHDILDKMREKDQDSTRTSHKTDKKYRPQFEFIDLWLPQEEAIVTMPGGGEDRPVAYLAEEEYTGPERGPYEQQGFHWIDGEIMPVPMMGIVYDIHQMINAMAWKAKNDAEASKTLVLYAQQAAGEAERIRTAQNLAMVAVQDPEHFKELHLGGVSPERYEYIAFLRQFMSEIMGNTDLMGGTRAKSETLGQDQMLYQQASMRLADLAGQTHAFVKRVAEKLGYYLWNSNRQFWVTMDPGATYEWQALFGGEYREGEYLEYEVDIQPYSMRADTPEAVYARMMQWLKEVILPLSELGMAQGAQLNVPLVAEESAKRLNIPLHRELYRQLPQPSMQMAMQESEQIPGQGERRQTNITVGRSGQPAIGRTAAPQRAPTTGDAA